MGVLEKIRTLLSDAFPKDSEQREHEPKAISLPQLPYEFSQSNENNKWDLPEGSLKLQPFSEYDMLDISETDVSKRHWPEGATLLKVATHNEGSDVFVIDDKPDVVAEKLGANQPVHAIIPPQGGLTILPEETYNFILSPVKSDVQQDISLN